jgi:phosphatidylserine/phosphatidylglycerophosphate/cardiolipin synthase-like enzyme
MAKRSTRKRKRSAAAQRQQRRLNLIVTIALIVGFGAVAAYYLATGSDPLGLFTQATPTTSSAPPAGGDWWRVHFTAPLHADEPQDLQGTVAAALIDHIDAAQSTIHIAAFEFNLTPVAEALIAAHQRGVEVLWVTDDEHGIEADEEEDHGQFAMLEAAGIQIRDDERSALMHNKFWIFDDRTVWTGSTNVTVNGVLRNNNNVIVIESPQLAAIYEREFDEMWAGEFGPTSASTADNQAVTVAGTPVQVFFAAEDEVASRLVPLIENADERIRFMAFSFTHDAMGAAVLARAEAGVDVQGIFETRGSETQYSQMPGLYCAGVPVRQDGNPRTFHHKVFVIDDEMVITGSFNFSANADDSNDENVLIVTNGEIAAQYLQEFERRWAEASDPDPADMNCP